MADAPLHIAVDPGPAWIAGAASPATATLGLAIRGMEVASEGVDLVIRGGGPRVAAGSPLYLRSEPPTEGIATLFVASAGENYGFFPADADLNLFVLRGPQAGMPLVLWNAGLAASATLHVGAIGFIETVPPPGPPLGPASFGAAEFDQVEFDDGTDSGTSTATTCPTLAITGTGGGPTATATLAIAGSTPPSIASSLDLAAPGIGFEGGQAPLYVNGWDPS